VPLQLFRPKLRGTLPGQETSIARRGPSGPTEAYVPGYVAGSAPGASNAASVVSHRYLYRPFVVSLSNHRWKALKTLPFDWLRVNGKCKEALGTVH